MSMEKQKALEMALVQIEKQFGKGSVMKLGDAANVPVSAIPTGCLELDVALGVGGVSGIVAFFLLNRVNRGAMPAA